MNSVRSAEVTEVRCLHTDLWHAQALLSFFNDPGASFLAVREIVTLNGTSAVRDVVLDIDPPAEAVCARCGALTVFPLLKVSPASWEQIDRITGLNGAALERVDPARSLELARLVVETAAEIAIGDLWEASAEHRWISDALCKFLADGVPEAPGDAASDLNVLFRGTHEELYQRWSQAYGPFGTREPDVRPVFEQLAIEVRKSWLVRQMVDEFAYARPVLVQPVAISSVDGTVTFALSYRETLQPDHRRSWSSTVRDRLGIAPYQIRLPAPALTLTRSYDFSMKTAEHTFVRAQCFANIDRHGRLEQLTNRAATVAGSAASGYNSVRLKARDAHYLREVANPTVCAVVQEVPPGRLLPAIALDTAALAAAVVLAVVLGRYDGLTGLTTGTGALLAGLAAAAFVAVVMALRGRRRMPPFTALVGLAWALFAGAPMLLAVALGNGASRRADIVGRGVLAAVATVSFVFVVRLVIRLHQARKAFTFASTLQRAPREAWTEQDDLWVAHVLEDV